MAFSPAAFAVYADTGDAEKPLPLADWNPAFCGVIDMHIRRDGSWLYNGSPILRPAMVRLFSRLLRKEGEAYFLVTPVEKVGITVEDVPFIAVEMTRGTGLLAFRTHAGDVVAADATHPLRFATDEDDSFIPYVEVRAGLEARLSQGLARDLAALVEWDGDACGIRSANCFFTISGLHPVFDSAS